MTEQTKSYLIHNLTSNTFTVAYNKATLAELLGVSNQRVHKMLEKPDFTHKKTNSRVKTVDLFKRLTNYAGNVNNFGSKKSI